MMVLSRNRVCFLGGNDKAFTNSGYIGKAGGLLPSNLQNIYVGFVGVNRECVGDLKEKLGQVIK